MKIGWVIVLGCRYTNDQFLCKSLKGFVDLKRLVMTHKISKKHVSMKHEFLWSSGMILALHSIHFGIGGI